MFSQRDSYFSSRIFIIHAHLSSCDSSRRQRRWIFLSKKTTTDDGDVLKWIGRNEENIMKPKQIFFLLPFREEMHNMKLNECTVETWDTIQTQRHKLCCWTHCEFLENTENYAARFYLLANWLVFISLSLALCSRPASISDINNYWWRDVFEFQAKKKISERGWWNEWEENAVKFIARFLGKSGALNDINGPRRKHTRVEGKSSAKKRKNSATQMEKNHQFSVKMLRGGSSWGKKKRKLFWSLTLTLCRK